MAKGKQEDGEIWTKLGQGLRYLERDEEAVEAYARAVELNPEDKNAWYFRSTILRKLGRLEEAEQAEERAASIRDQKSS